MQVTKKINNAYWSKNKNNKFCTENRYAGRSDFVPIMTELRYWWGKKRKKKKGKQERKLIYR